MESTDAKALPDDTSLLKQMVTELLASLSTYEKRVERLQHTLEQFMRDRYRLE